MSNFEVNLTSVLCLSVCLSVCGGEGVRLGFLAEHLSDNFLLR